MYGIFNDLPNDLIDAIKKQEKLNKIEAIHKDLFNDVINELNYMSPPDLVERGWGAMNIMKIIQDNESDDDLDFI